jgi:hypothetical protein
MTDDKKEPTFELHSWFDGGDIFFRPKDKSRLAKALDAIVESDLGVAIIGSNEAILDHYCRMLVARMRKLERFQLDVFLPVTTDSLLTRFNEMLSEVSLEQAAKPPVEGQAVRLLVINDARVVNDSQWGLLVRLLADFPGVNVRLVVVINKSGWPAHEKLLHSLGKKMHRWVVNVPAADEARQLLDAAAENGYQVETEALLLDAGLGALVTTRKAKILEQQGQDPDLPELPELDLDVLLGRADADERQADAVNQTDSSGGSFWRITMIVSLSLALSSVALLWLYEGSSEADQRSSQAVVQESQSSEPAKGYKMESIAVPTDAQIEAKRLKAQADLATSTAPEAIATDPPLVDSPEPTESEDLMTEPDSAAEPISRELAAEESSAQEPVPVALSNEAPAAPKVSPVLPQPPAEPVLTVLEKAAQDVASASPSAYFVQHTVLSTELAAKGYIDRYEVLRQARVVPVRLRQSIAYSVVSGPFESRSTAALFTQNKAIPDDYWIRSAVQLQAVLRR